jgi:isoquinoline 1-oxidoreductase beta subunit
MSESRQVTPAKANTVSRREFIVASAAAGAGLVIGFYVRGSAKFAPARVFSPNAFLKITPAGDVTVVVSKAEMGQGVRTAAAMIVAEELDADWSRVRIEQAEANERVYGDQGTGGSSSMRELFDPLRRAGAIARTMLIAAAAQKWNVTPNTCRTDNGHVIHDNNRLSYGELAGLAATVPVPGRPQLKEASQYRLIGKPKQRIDTPSKANGTAKFGIDTEVPGMLHAVVARCPVFGGKLQKFDAAKALAIPGVKHVFAMENSVAVVANSTWAALEGRRALEVTWNEGPNAKLSSADISRQFREALNKSAWPYVKSGDVTHVTATHRMEALYEVPFLAQAPMEPMNCTASYHDGICEVWAPSQNSTMEVQKHIGDAVGLDADRVKLYATLMGGGFGRRLQDDYATEAAKVSKHMAAPVKVTWTREDEMQGGFYRQNGLHRLVGAIDARGVPVAWHHTLVAPTLDVPPPTGPGPYPNDAVQDEHPFLYGIPNVLLDYVMSNTPVTVGPWRSVYASHLAFASEHFFDELVRAAHQDPFLVRRDLLAGDRVVQVMGRSYNTSRLRNVLEVSATKSNWGSPGAGRSQGIACWGAWGSYVAQVAEVSVSGADIRVHRVVCAVDCGQVINPGIVEQQMHSAIIFGLSAALKGAITIENGRAQQTNFDSYQVLRMNEVPEIEVYITQSTQPVSGIGEPAVPVIAPAVANAVLAATGKPVRKLPMLSAVRRSAMLDSIGKDSTVMLRLV